MIDADEYITKALGFEISSQLEKLDKSINGIFIPRKIIFKDKLIRFGGINPTKVLRLLGMDLAAAILDGWMSIFK